MDGVIQGQVVVARHAQARAPITLHKAPYGPLVGVCGVLVALFRYQPLGSLKPSYGHSMRAEGLVRSGGIFLIGGNDDTDKPVWIHSLI